MEGKENFMSEGGDKGNIIGKKKAVSGWEEHSNRLFPVLIFLIPISHR